MNSSSLHIQAVCASALSTNTGSVNQRDVSDCLLAALQRLRPRLVDRAPLLSGPKPAFPVTICEHTINFQITTLSKMRYNLFNEYGCGSSSPGVHFTLVCIDGTRLEEAAVGPQLLRLWEDPATAGTWAILVALRNGNRCLLEAPQLDQMRRTYQVPVFVMNPLEDASVVTVFRLITSYAAAMTDTVPWDRVYPEESYEDAKRTGGVPSLSAALAPWTALPFAHQRYTDVLLVLFGAEVLKAVEHHSRAAHPATMAAFTRAIRRAAAAGDDPRQRHAPPSSPLLRSQTRPVSVPAYYIDCARLEQLARDIRARIYGVSADMLAQALLERALRVCVRAQRQLWCGRANAAVVAAEVRQRVRVGELCDAWKWWWDRTIDGYGAGFAGRGLGVSGVKSRAAGVSVAVRARVRTPRPRSHVGRAGGGMEVRRGIGRKSAEWVAGAGSNNHAVDSSATTAPATRVPATANGSGDGGAVNGCLVHATGILVGQPGTTPDSVAVVAASTGTGTQPVTGTGNTVAALDSTSREVTEDSAATPLSVHANANTLPSASAYPTRVLAPTLLHTPMPHGSAVQRHAAAHAQRSDVSAVFASMGLSVSNTELQPWHAAATDTPSPHSPPAHAVAGSLEPPAAELLVPLGLGSRGGRCAGAMALVQRMARAEYVLYGVAGEGQGMGTGKAALSAGVPVQTLPVHTREA